MGSERRRPLVRITAIWDGGSESRFPETLRVPMEGGVVVNYRIDIQQPRPVFPMAIGAPRKKKHRLRDGGTSARRV